MACTELDTLDSGAVVSLGGQSSRNWWAPGAPGGDEHRRPPAAPGPQGLVGALLKFPGPQVVPPRCASTYPHRGPQTAVAMQRGDECPPQGPGASRGKRLFPAPGAPWRRGAPRAQISVHGPHPSAQLVSPTQCRGPKVTLYFSFSVALVESWLVSGDLRGEGVIR